MEGESVSSTGGLDAKLLPLLSFVLAGGLPAFIILSAGLGQNDSGAKDTVGATIYWAAGALASGGLVALITWAITRSTVGLVKGVVLVLVLAGATIWGSMIAVMGLMVVLIELHGPW